MNVFFVVNLDESVYCDDKEVDGRESKEGKEKKVIKNAVVAPVEIHDGYGELYKGSSKCGKG